MAQGTRSSRAALAAQIEQDSSYKKTGTLLDVGTGIGLFLSMARTEYTAVYGTEVSSMAIGVAKEKFGLDLFHGTVDDLLAEGRTFDNVTLFQFWSMFLTQNLRSKPATLFSLQAAV